MMKLIVTVLLYNLLLQSNVDGEPMVKVQICSSIFVNATKDALNRMEQSALMKGIPNFRVKFSGARGRERYQTKEIPLTKVNFELLEKFQMLSHDRSETRFRVKIEYGNKKFRKERMQNPYLFLNLEIIVTLLFDVDKDEMFFNVQECNIYLKNYETNANGKLDLHQGKIKGKLVSRLCLVVNQIIDILNENWKDYLKIDPSGNKSLLLKSSSFNPPNCLQLNLNLVSGNSEVISSQIHAVLKGNAISIAEDYFKTIFYDVFQLSVLNTKLENKNLQLEPEQLSLLIHDIHETDSTNMTIAITEMPQLSLNSLNRTMTNKIKLEGFSSKSDKPILKVIFETKLNVDLQLDNMQLTLRFLSCGGQFITSGTSSIGNSGDLDYENLAKLIKKLVTETIWPLFKDLRVSFHIPFWMLGSKVVFKMGTVEIIP